MKCSACMVVSFVLLILTARSQQVQQPQASAAQHMQPGNVSTCCAYRHILFLAPNKVYGYNILLNGKLVLYQPATQQSTDKNMPAITTKVRADKAAALAIEKLRRGIAGELSPAELSHITRQ